MMMMIMMMICTYFINIILHVMGRPIYNLLPYEISHDYVHWASVIRNGNLTKHFYCRHLDIAQSITIYT